MVTIYLNACQRAIKNSCLETVHKFTYKLPVIFFCLICTSQYLNYIHNLFKFFYQVHFFLPIINKESPIEKCRLMVRPLFRITYYVGV